MTRTAEQWKAWISGMLVLWAVAACGHPAADRWGWARPPHGLYNHSAAPSGDQTPTALPTHGTGPWAGPGTVRSAGPNAPWLAYDPVRHTVALQLIVTGTRGRFRLNGYAPEALDVTVPLHWSVHIVVWNHTAQPLRASVVPGPGPTPAILPGHAHTLMVVPDHSGVWRIGLLPGPQWLALRVKSNQLPSVRTAGR
ncbi:MAG: hypothetical protein K6U14_11700 [Firmicutes bacterium]|nr:hypothetical protein [Alicyclobacillaceae bacterium]MCL6498278.1 hypothetical protein [Bacillota bacterium]